MHSWTHKHTCTHTHTNSWTHTHAHTYNVVHEIQFTNDCTYKHANAHTQHKQHTPFLDDQSTVAIDFGSAQQLSASEVSDNGSVGSQTANQHDPTPEHTVASSLGALWPLASPYLSDVFWHKTSSRWLAIVKRFITLNCLFIVVFSGHVIDNLSVLSIVSFWSSISYNWYWYTFIASHAKICEIDFFWELAKYSVLFLWFTQKQY